MPLPNIEFETHKLDEFLEWCLEHHGYFFMIQSDKKYFINSLKNLDTIRYPSKLDEGDSEILLRVMDKFAYDVRYLINIEIFQRTGNYMKDDLISRLQRGDFFSRDMTKPADLEIAFFKKNKYFQRNK